MTRGEEERDRLRELRLQDERHAPMDDRRRLVAGYLIGAAFAVSLIAGLVALITSGGGDGASASGSAHININSGSTNGVEPDQRDGIPPAPAKDSELRLTAKKAGCVLRENLPNEGNRHLMPGARTPRYGSDPPTSGNHIIPPLQQADGAYIETPRPTHFVHSLEHGRVTVQYDPKLSKRDQLALKGLYDEAFAGALLFPNPDMPYEVAVASWQNLLGCSSYAGPKTLDAVRSFGAEKLGRTAPEPLDAFPLLPGPRFNAPSS